jgi:ion channel-forming bestrophin family protein
MLQVAIFYCILIQLIQDLNHLLNAMELSPYHTHRFPGSPASASPATVQNGLPSANPEGQYGTFEANTPADPNAPLLPSSTIHRKSRVSVYMDLVPFSSWFSAFKSIFSRKKNPVAGAPGQTATAEGSGKHVVIAGGGGNIPLEIIRTLSEWMAALEERGTVPGTTLGGMIAMLQMLEDTLTMLERILTTPLPL